MEIVSASDDVTITDMGITYLLYTFAPSFGRYDDLYNNHSDLQSFLKECEHTPNLYDVQFQEQGEEEYIALTVQKPEFQPLSEQDEKLDIEDVHRITVVLCETLSMAREYGIYNLDIGLHSICYDSNLYDVQIVDWYDGVFEVPASPPFYISENIPPEFQQSLETVTETELVRAENYQVSCLIINLLYAAGITENIPQALQHGCSGAVDERPTLETIQASIRELQATY